MPTDAYSLDEAVADGYLVPPKAISVPLKIVRSGLRYDDLSEEEKDQWDMLEWGEDGDPRQRRGRRGQQAAVQQRHRRPRHRASDAERHQGRGRRPARQDDHLRQEPGARAVHRGAIQRGLSASRRAFRAGHHPRDRAYAQTLIDDFSKKNKAPHIAISVDMLDTGIDVPEVVNLVFFKQVRSKTKFWQMMGRGTRLCPDLFGPGQDKEFFRVFDYCQNLEFFGANPETEGGRHGEVAVRAAVRGAARSGARARREDGEAGRLRARRPDALSAPTAKPPPSEDEIRADALKTLQDTVAGLNLDNFIVRQHRRAVEKYREPEAWATIDDETREELVDEIAPLPSAQALGTEEAKRFDLLMFSLELALLKGSKRFDALQEAAAGDRVGAGRPDRHSGDCAAGGADRGNPDRPMVGRRHRPAAGTGPAAPARSRPAHREVEEGDRLFEFRRRDRRRRRASSCRRSARPTSRASSRRRGIS